MVEYNYVAHKQSRSWSIKALLKFSSCNFPRLTLIISSNIFIRDSSSGLPALWYFISIIAFMVTDSMLMMFCCSIIFLRLFPVIDLQSFLIHLFRVFNDVFVEFRILCVKLMKRFSRENLIWRVCESGSIRNLCEQRLSFIIFLIATFHVFPIAAASPQNRYWWTCEVSVEDVDLVFVVKSAKENSWHLSLFFWINCDLFSLSSCLVLAILSSNYFQDDASISPMEGYFHITSWVLNPFPS